MELNKIYNVDCVEGMKQLPDNYIDLTVTSPPYDDLREYSGFSWDFKQTINELYRVTKEGGVVIWVIGDATIDGSETGSSFMQALYFKEVGFNLHDTMLYRKISYQPSTQNRYEQEFEYMFAFSKGKPKSFNPIMLPCKYAGESSWGNVTHYKKDGTLVGKGKRVINDFKRHGNIFEYLPNRAKETKGHPAPYPLQLAIDQIRSWSDKGDIILDPFMGSGTTGLASLKLGRSFIGFEISKDYCNIADRRLKKIKSKFI